MSKKNEYVVKVKEYTQLLLNDEEVHLPKAMYITVKADIDRTFKDVPLADCPDELRCQHDNIMKKLTRRLLSGKYDFHVDSGYGIFGIKMKGHIEWQDDPCDITVCDMATSVAERKESKNG